MFFTSPLPLFPGPEHLTPLLGSPIGLAKKHLGTLGSRNRSPGRLVWKLWERSVRAQPAGRNWGSAGLTATEM